MGNFNTMDDSLREFFRIVLLYTVCMVTVV